MQILPTVLLLGAVGAVYAFAVRPYLMRREAPRAAIQSVDAAIVARLKGVRTILCAGAAALVPEVPDLLHGLLGIDWTAVVFRVRA
jgi:hypothetical protein